MCVLQRRHLARPKESCRRCQSSDTIDSIRSMQPSGADKLLFKVRPWLRYQDRTPAQAHPQGPTVVLDKRTWPHSQPTERSTCKHTLTAYFDPEKDTVISVDASPVVLAAILSQVDPETEESHVITCASRSLTATEERYNQTERKALAVVWACEHLHLYVDGKPVADYTDHKPLVSIYGNPSSKPSARIDRWALRLQPYQIILRFTYHVTQPSMGLKRGVAAVK